jgi:transposase
MDKTKGKDKDKGDRAFKIDARKLAEEARFDGIFVLRTNANVTPLQAMLRYGDLLQVENLFPRTKAIMRTQPIFHSSDAAIRGHAFCSFLVPRVIQNEGKAASVLCVRRR